MFYASLRIAFATLVATTLMALAPKAHAGTPTFDDLTSADFDNIAKELSANGALHSVTPASSMGSIFGFEVGLIGGATNTPDTDAIVKRASPSTDVKAFPHAGILGAVTVPFGITGELVFIPKLNASGIEYQQYAAALKWTLTDSLLGMLPLNLAVRGYVSKTEVSFNQTINNASTGNTNVDASVKYEGTVTGLQLLASPKLIPIIEPYVGVGVLSANSKMSSSVGSIFQSGSQSAESSPTSTEFLLGADLRLLLIGVGAEYSRSFGTDSYTAKFSFRF